VNAAMQRNGVWTPEMSYLERTDDLPGKMALDAVIAQLAARFDGTQTLEVLLRRFASEYDVPAEQAIPEGLRVIRRLGEAGLVLLDRAG
jgi:hypothetical protein